MDNNQEKEHLNADMVVVGAGGAGLATAVSAAESGAHNIIVLEKRAIGGTSAMAGGIFAAESPVQKRLMVDCRRDDCFKKSMTFSHWETNPRIVRTFIDRSGDTVKWFEDKGIIFRLIPMYPGQIATWHVPQGLGIQLINLLAAECEKHGARILKKTAAMNILTGNDKRISGIAVEKEGKSMVIRTGCVVIATGGYGGNLDLLKQYSRKYRDNMGLGMLPNMGDGLRMAVEMGAGLENPGTLLLSGPGAPGFINIHYESRKIHFPVMAITLEPYSIWVNKKGKRFADEMVGYSHFQSSNTVVQQPGAMSFTILDHAMMQDIEAQGLILGMGDPEGAQGNKLPGFIMEVESLAEKGIVKISSSWHELAAWMGSDPQTLACTIGEYNEACDRGCDPVFAKDRIYLRKICNPPYYVFKCQTGILNTIGGIKINELMEVLDAQENLIPGLYAAGVDTGGWMPETYNCELSGSAFGFAINSGRIAGENAAKYLRDSI
jgi:fumarate reductase flavoprotein subunit